MMLSIGCSARLSSTDEAMIAPAEISPAIASSAPRPSADDWTNIRKNLLVAVRRLPTIWAPTMCASAIRRLSSCRATMAPVMPRPRIVAPCIAAACCALSAAAMAVDATSIRAWVERWFRHASVTSRIAETTAMIPIQK